MTCQLRLALVVICWILWTYSRIRSVLFEGWWNLGAVVPFVPQVDLHIKIEHMSFLFERLVLRVTPCWIDSYISTCVFRAFLNHWQLLLICPLLVLKIVQNVLIFLFLFFLDIYLRVFVAGSSEAAILVVVLVLGGQIVYAVESHS